MQDIEIKLLLYRAVKRFYREESHFIMDGINEVGIVSRIAIHMDRIIREIEDMLCYQNISTDYNHLEIFTEFDRAYKRGKKQISLKQITDDNGRILKVRPDLLLLKVNSHFKITDNILVLEAKKLGSRQSYNADKVKLRSFVNPRYGEHNYQYQLGVHLMLGKMGFILIWYKAFEPLIGAIWKSSDSEKPYSEIPINEEYTTQSINDILNGIITL